MNLELNLVFQGVYIWNAADGSIVQLCQKEAEDEYITSVAWIAHLVSSSRPNSTFSLTSPSSLGSSSSS